MVTAVSVVLRSRTSQNRSRVLRWRFSVARSVLWLNGVVCRQSDSRGSEVQNLSGNGGQKARRRDGPHKGHSSVELSLEFTDALENKVWGMPGVSRQHVPTDVCKGINAVQDGETSLQASRSPAPVAGGRNSGAKQTEGRAEGRIGCGSYRGGLGVSWLPART